MNWQKTCCMPNIRKIGHRFVNHFHLSDPASWDRQWRTVQGSAEAFSNICRVKDRPATQQRTENGKLQWKIVHWRSGQHNGEFLVIRFRNYLSLIMSLRSDVCENSKYESLFILLVRHKFQATYFSHLFLIPHVGILQGIFITRSIECGTCCNANRFIPVIMTLQRLAHRGIFHGWKWEEEAGGSQFWCQMSLVVAA